MADPSLTELRVLREVAERGSFTAAARSLGYTQSAVSRQVAALEAAMGEPLCDRDRGGVRLTDAGARVLAMAGRVLAEVEAARRDLQGERRVEGPVRLGAFPSASAAMVPSAVAAVEREHPGVRVTLREGSTPQLVRALRAGSVDLALLAATPPYRPLDGEEPPLDVEVLSESRLMVGVGPGHPFAGRAEVDVDELEGQRWIASRSDAGESLLGVWPGLPGRPEIGFTTRDWLAKLALVAEGLAITTVPAALTAAVPARVHLVRVRGGADERRRLLLGRRPDAPLSEGARALADALRAYRRGPVQSSDPRSTP